MSAPTAVSPQGVQFVAQPQSHSIEVTNASGTKRHVGRLGQARGQFNYPADFAVLGETGYVVETGNHRVQAFDASGNSLGMIGEGVLFYPGGIAAANGEILVADSRHGRIVGFDSQGHVTRMIGEGVLSAPRGLTSVGDSIYVADPGLRKIVQFGQDGSLRGKLGQWVLPYDVATDGLSQLYVLDASTSEVTVTGMDGTRTASIPLDRAASRINLRGGTLFVS
jgi:DNA-binding beta-propeller fold protein YncE